jgi:2-amino-4-hydroxy-6-hydroxymethyldihydropteridine diphosphokinase
MARAFIALGSNLEQPSNQIQRAFIELAALPKTTLVRRSGLYRSVPVGYDHQPDFINAVAEVDTQLKPLSLLHALFALENLHGRERPFPNAPRVIDLDLLLYDDVAMQTAELNLPHPRMHERGFVLLPLAEIAPELIIPDTADSNQASTQGLKVADLARKFIGQGVTRING